MSPIVPEHAGLFQVTIRVLDEDRDWCVENKAGFDDYALQMIEGGEGLGVGALPATSVEKVKQQYALVLRWDHVPGDGPWSAADSILDLGKTLFPAFLTETDDLSVEVERETRLGRDVEISDDDAARYELLAAQLLDTTVVPPTWLDGGDGGPDSH